MVVLQRILVLFFYFLYIYSSIYAFLFLIYLLYVQMCSKPADLSPKRANLLFAVSYRLH